MKLVKRLTKLLRSKTHRPERQPLTVACTWTPHGEQTVTRITDELPAVLFLACGCFRTRKYPLLDDDGIAYESRSECTELDDSLRRLFAGA